MVEFNFENFEKRFHFEKISYIVFLLSILSL